MRKLLGVFSSISYVLSLGLMIYVVLFQFSSFLSVDLLHFDPRMNDADYLRLLISGGFIGAGAGMLFEYLMGNKIRGSFMEENPGGKGIIIITSLFLSYFYTGSAQLLSIKNITIFAVCLIFFIYYLPKVIWYLSDFDFTFKNIRMMNTGIAVRNKIILTFFSILGVMLLSAIAINIFAYYLKNKSDGIPAKGSALFIQSVEPKSATLTQKVTISGFNFGWKNNDTYKVMSKEEELRQTEWTNEKIDISIPLSMKSGDNELWIVRPKSENGLLEESNHVKIRIIDRFVFYPVENEPKWQRGIKRIKRFLFFNVKIFNDYF